MVWTISVILLSVWLVGVTTASTLHGYIHLLLAAAAVAILVPLFSRRKQPLDWSINAKQSRGMIRQGRASQRGRSRSAEPGSPRTKGTSAKTSLGLFGAHFLN
jgi:hypothetical protein